MVYGAQHGLGARHGLWLLDMVLDCSGWSRNLMPVVGHVTNFCKDLGIENLKDLIGPRFIPMI